MKPWKIIMTRWLEADQMTQLVLERENLRVITSKSGRRHYFYSTSNDLWGEITWEEHVELGL